jgi:hypothetical protein
MVMMRSGRRIVQGLLKTRGRLFHARQAQFTAPSLITISFKGQIFFLYLQYLTDLHSFEFTAHQGEPTQGTLEAKSTVL